MPTPEDIIWLEQQKDNERRWQFLDFYFRQLAGKTLAVLYKKSFSRDPETYATEGDLVAAINKPGIDPYTGLPDYRTTIFYFRKDIEVKRRTDKGKILPVIFQTPMPIEILEIRVLPKGS